MQGVFTTYVGGEESVLVTASCFTQVRFDDDFGLDKRLLI